MEREILKKATVDSSEQSNSYTKILICMRTFDETYQADIYSGIEKSCFRFMEARGWLATIIKTPIVINRKTIFWMLVIMGVN
jgi:hypothetical protein